MAPTPVTIVTGFLGSGKTTLLLNLLPQLRATNPSYKLALLKNEFGDVAVDSQLASSSAISGVQELLNGCICCNQVGQLSDSLKELSSTVRPDRIVIETSGSAFPATLAIEINRLSRETDGAYVLDGVVSVIDVENWQGYEDTSYTARIQARYTDLIVFNKWELCDERRFDEVLDRVGDLEVDIAWVKSDKGRVPVDVIFGIDGGLARALVDDAEGNHDGKTTNGHSHEHEHKHDHQTEVEVLSVTLKPSSPATSAAVVAVNPSKLAQLLKSAPKDEVYRIKAVLTAPTGSVRNSEDHHNSTDKNADSKQNGSQTPSSSQQSTQRYILNWAFGRWTFTPLLAASAPPATSSSSPSATTESTAESTTSTEHGSTEHIPLRMTLILARYESTKWKKKLETGGFLELLSSASSSTSDGAASAAGVVVEGELTVHKIA